MKFVVSFRNKHQKREHILCALNALTASLMARMWFAMATLFGATRSNHLQVKLSTDRLIGIHYIGFVIDVQDTYGARDDVKGKPANLLNLG